MDFYLTVVYQAFARWACHRLQFEVEFEFWVLLYLDLGSCLL